MPKNRSPVYARGTRNQRRKHFKHLKNQEKLREKFLRRRGPRFPALGRLVEVIVFLAAIFGALFYFGR